MRRPVTDGILLSRRPFYLTREALKIIEEKGRGGLVPEALSVQRNRSLLLL